MKVATRAKYEQTRRKFFTEIRFSGEPGELGVNTYTASAAVIMPSILFGSTEMRNSYMEVFFQLMITEISF
jgi:hypothetical protein